jgi:hypothetical protein
MEMRLGLSLNCISVVAKTTQALLSLNTLEGGRDGVWSLSDIVEVDRVMKLCV